MNRTMDSGQKSWPSESELLTVQENREMEAAQTLQVKQHREVLLDINIKINIWFTLLLWNILLISLLEEDF